MPPEPLPEEIRVLPGTDVEGARVRFEVFEALHHGMRICNPMSDGDLDGVIAALGLASGDRVVDAGCGHGELLIRAAEREEVEGVGVDLSPWALARAHDEALRRPLRGWLCWWLGDAKQLPTGPWDAACCLGATWIWNGFSGTARALAGRLRPGGRVAIGDLALQEGAVPRDAPGRVLTLEEQGRLLAAAGFEYLESHPSGRSALDDYHDRVAESARRWVELRPGDTAYLEEQRRWSEDHRRDRDLLRWVAWTGRRAGADPSRRRPRPGKGEDSGRPPTPA